MRVALGLQYLGAAYQGWQSQPSGQTVQDQLERALGQLLDAPAPRVMCAGRTDTGVHALHQVVHFDTPAPRPLQAWVRGTNRYLPHDIAVQWAREVPPTFHARGSALARRYAYVVRQSPVRPGLDHDRVGWVFQPLDQQAMTQALNLLLGTHDFTSFRAAQCQALSPVKTLQQAGVMQVGTYWRFDFQADAFLHHMIRNILGCVLQVGAQKHPPEWINEVLAARSRDAAAPTFAAAGLYFLGPVYTPDWGLPAYQPQGWLPGD